MVEARKDVKTTIKPAEKVVKPTAARAEAKQAAPVEETKTEAVAVAKTEAVPTKKAPARKTAAEKAPAKTTATKKEPVKKDTAKKGTVKKEAEKKEVKAPAGKTAARKTEPKVKVHFRLDEKNLVAKNVLNRTVKACKGNHKSVEIKAIELYITANEGTAYYVANGEANDDFKVVP